MAYAQREQIGSNRIAAIVVVAIIHLALGYALITGLAYTVIQKTADNLKTFNVEEPPPPPVEEPPPPPPETVSETPPPPVVAPPPVVKTEVAPPPPVRTVREAPPPAVTYTAEPQPPAPPRPAPPPPPPPLPPAVEPVPPRSAVGNLQGLFRGSDYPQRAIEADEQGVVTVRLSISATGRVAGCDVTSSSGSRTLDRATCQILSNRARFEPARDSRGNRTADAVRQRIRWVLEG